MPFDLNVGAVPEPVQPLALGSVLRLHSLLPDPVESSAAAVDQFARGYPAGGVIGDDLVDLDRQTRPGLHPEHHLPGVLIVEDQGVVAVLGGDGVVDSDAQSHPGIGAPVAEQDPVVFRPVTLWHQHAGIEGLTLAGVRAASHGSGAHVILILTVLPIQRLGRDHDGGLVIKHRHLDAEHRQMSLGERDHPRRANLDPFASGRAPDDVPAEHAVPKVEAAVIGLQVRDG